MMFEKGVTIHLKAQIYINFAADIIWPIGGYSTQALEDSYRRDIQYIAVSIPPVETTPSRLLLWL